MAIVLEVIVPKAIVLPDSRPATRRTARPILIPERVAQWIAARQAQRRAGVVVP